MPPLGLHSSPGKCKEGGHPDTTQSTPRQISTQHLTECKYVSTGGQKLGYLGTFQMPREYFILQKLLFATSWLFQPVKLTFIRWSKDFRDRINWKGLSWENLKKWYRFYARPGTIHQVHISRVFSQQLPGFQFTHHQEDKEVWDE